MSDAHLKNWVLDKNQKLGVISEGRLVVTAGAGTGKTRVLTHRFAHLVLSGRATVEQVLAITFTEQAAAQMATRVAELFEKQGRNDLRRKLTDAPISTIHAFCYKLLKENSIDAGIDPSFEILSEFEKERMTALAIDEALDKIQKQEPDGYEKLTRTVRTEGRFGADIKEAVQNIYHLLRIGRIPIEKAFEIPNPNERYNELLRQTRTMIDEYRAVAAERKITQTMKTNEVFITELLEKLDTPDTESVAKICSSVKLDLRMAKDLKGSAASLNALILELAHTAAESYALDMQTRDLLRDLVRFFDESFKRAKQDKSLLDFSDLEQCTLDFLENRSDLAKNLQDRFKFVLVDEFQDVNPLQADIIERISREGNLFIVGDHKQSIYGFRQADVRVFQNEVQSVRGQRISLVNNYRTHKTILDFVNLYFESAWSELPKEIAYEGLVPGKECQKVITNSPKVEILATLSEPNIDIREAEARSIASRILQMTSQEETERKDFLDITVLFRSKTKIAPFLAEFIRRRIPFQELKGRGLFNRAEVVDLQHFLEVLSNPYDELALAAVLRSPFAEINNEGLFHLCIEARNQGDGLWETCKNADIIESLDKDCATKVKRLVATRRSILKDWALLSVDRLVCEIFERTGYRKWALTQTDAARKIGNIEQIIRHAQSFSAAFGSSPGGLAEALADFRSLGIKAQDSPTGSPENTIALMTVHAAKGLESPVVFIADCNHKESGNSDPIDYHPKEGVGFKVYLSDFTSVDTTTLAALKKRKKKDDLQENLRLFYVALTRAKKHLTLSTAFRPDSRNTIRTYGWAKMLIDFLGLKTKKYDSWPQVLEPGNGVSIKVTKAGELTEWPTDRPAKHPKIDRRSVLKHYDSLPETVLPPDRSRYLYSVSEIMTFSECPRRFYLLSRLRLPVEFLPAALEDDFPIEYSSNPAESPKIEPVQFGNAVHDLFARIDSENPYWKDFAKEVCKLHELDEKSTSNALAAFETFWANSEIGNFRNGSVFLHELPFLWKAPFCIVKGKIDLLIPTEEGNWLIDYKTNRIGKAGIENISKRYQLQMILYSLAHKGLYGKLPERTSLYFTQVDRFIDIDLNKEALENAQKSIENCVRADANENYPANLSKCPDCNFRAWCMPKFPAGNQDK